MLKGYLKSLLIGHGRKKGVKADGYQELRGSQKRRKSELEKTYTLLFFNFNAIFLLFSEITLLHQIFFHVKKSKNLYIPLYYLIE